ncbi:MAG: hypothetical protein ACEPOW_10825 [Bacteroidales bacterium]
MKTKNITFRLLLIAFIFTYVTSCKKDQLDSQTPQSASAEKIATLNSVDEPKEMMTLAAIAMRFHDGAREDLTRRMLAMSNLSTNNKWELVWYAYNERKSAQMMIVKHKDIPNTYTIASKGQHQSNIFSLIHGVHVFGREPFPWVKPGHAKPYVAEGARMIADLLFDDIRADAPSLNVTNGTLQDVLSAITNKWNKNEKLNIYTTGHSLGGANSVMIGTYVHTFFSTRKNIPDGKINLRMFNYAGPNLFRSDFVKYYNDLKKDTHINVKQYFYLIKNDVVCNFFPHNMDGLYDAFPWAWTMKIPIRLFIRGFNAGLNIGNIRYEQVGSYSDRSRIILVNKEDPNKFDVPNKIWFLDGYAAYYKYNHFTSSYLVSLGAPAVPEVENGQITTTKSSRIRTIDGDQDLHYVPTEEQINEYLKKIGAK